MANKLRNVEKLVLGKLEINSRESFLRIGKKIRKSQQRVSYTVNSLIDKGVIKKFYTIIDYSKLNMLSFRVYFKVNYISEARFRDLVSFFVKNPHTSWVATCGGRYDLICTFLASNPSQFNKVLKEIMEKFPDQLKNYIVLTTIVTRRFGRKYFFRDFILPEVIFGGDRVPEEIDELDIKILNEISEDARKSSVKISEKLSSTPKTIIERIKKLQKRKITEGFKPLLDPRNMGYIPTLLLIKYHNVSSRLENKLINYLKMHQNVISVVKTLGQWDVEIEIEVRDVMELRKVEMEIRENFALLIQQIESIPIYLSYKKNYFPEFLLK
ncbi:Lrp/AsnC family transcriptional regulator [Candidatus Woesearchaeota archaeon]|nr:Lrp/AsnC family transcriptional regulator [Candidatus Woesearchaeota archaeon]